MTTVSISKLSPSNLARLILCPAYVGAPFDNESRLRFQGLHAIAVLRVITRHIKQGFRLQSLEKRGNGFRVDLEFLGADGRLRVSEVKSAKELSEVHRIQAALYCQDGNYDEVVLSNRAMDVLLPREYIEEVRRQAEATKQLLKNNPEQAAISFRPNACVCRICANYSCPFLPEKTDQGRSSPAK